MINSFRRMRTGKPDGSGRKRTGDGEADGSGGSCSGCSAVRAARALLPRMASGERSEAPHCSRSQQQQQDPAAFFFLCCCFCGCRLSAAAARALLPMAIGERKRIPHRSRNETVFSLARDESTATAAGVQLFGLHQRGRGQQNSRRCSAVRAPAARAETLKNANGKILFSQLGKLCRVRLSWLLFPVDGSI